MTAERVALLLAVLTLTPSAVVPSVDAEEPTEAWWDPDWHFRLPLTLGTTGTDALRATDLAGARDALVLVPVDFTAALRATHAAGDGTGWPFDGAGRPLAWTLDAASLRVVPVDEAGRPAGSPYAARFLPFDVTTSDAAAYDAAVNARGTLAVVLPGVLDAPRRVHVYFDTVEHGPKPAQALAPRDAARLDVLVGPGPAVTFHAFVPPVRAGTLTLTLVATTDAPARVAVHRETPGAAAEALEPDASVEPGRVTRVPLPQAEGGYGLRVAATRPILALLETTGSTAPDAAFFHAAVDGGTSGHAFLVPGREAGGGPRTLHVIGTTGRTTVSIVDAASGEERDAFTVSAQAVATTEVPPGTLARVTASAPVLVADAGAADAAGSGFLAQGVTLAGAGQGNLLIAPRAAGHAALATTPATVTAFPLDAPANAVAGRVGDAPRYAWATRQRATADATPWAFAADDTDLTVVTGARGYAALLGRDGARAWRVPLAPDAPDDADRTLAAALVAPFPGTGVTVRHLGLDGAPAASATVTLGRAGVLSAFPDGSRPLAGEDLVLDVATTRPAALFAYAPGAPANAALPGVPPVVTVETGALTYHGALLAWDEPARDVTARPGERLTLTLTLANHGRARDGSPLVEDVQLALAPASAPGCDAAVDVALVTASLPAFAAPGTRDVRVLLTVPEDAEDAACARYRVTARSAAPDGGSASADVTLRVRAGFEPELRVLAEDGRARDAHTVTVPTGEEASVLLRLRNVGGAAGDARIAFAPAPGYTTVLEHADNGTLVAGEDGRATTPLPLAANASVLLRFRAHPVSPAEPPWDFRVEAASVEDATLRAGVTITVIPQPDVTLTAHAADPQVLLPPGGAATTALTVTHRGEPLDVRVRPVTDLPDGWNVSVSPRRMLLGAASPDADPVAVNVTVAVPRNARVGTALPIAVAFEPALAPQAGTRVTLTARVVNDHAARVTPLVPGVSAPPGGTGAITLRVESHAAAASRVHVDAVAAPAGWTLALPENGEWVEPARAVDVRIPFMIAPGAPALRDRLVLVTRLTDDASPDRRVNVTVNATTLAAPVLVIEPVTPGAAFAPEESRDVPFLVRNVGNVPAALAVEATVDAPEWSVTYDPAPEDVLPPNGARLIHARVTAPARLDPADAPVLRLRVSADGALDPAEQVIALQPLVRDLALQAVRSDGDVLHVTVENRGTSPIPGVRVTLEAEDAVLARFDRAGLAAGASVVHVLPAPAALANVRVHVEGTDGVRDATPGDNARSVRDDLPGPADTPRGPLAATRDAPAASGMAAIALTLILAVLTRRRVR